MALKPFFLCVALYAAVSSAMSAPVSAAGPPLPLIIVPNTAQERAQAQLSLQQAQTQTRVAASQAQIQAQLNADQARLEGQLAAQQAGTQAQRNAERQSTATAAQIAALSLGFGGPMQEPVVARIGAMELTTLTPQLGSYFGTNHGVLVVHAPTHGILKLQDGDVILSIGGRIPANRSQAIRILTSYDPGEKIRLVVLREHHRLDITAMMPAAPAVP